MIHTKGVKDFISDGSIHVRGSMPNIKFDSIQIRLPIYEHNLVCSMFEKQCSNSIGVR